MHAAALVLLMLMIYIVGTRPPPLAGFFQCTEKVSQPPFSSTNCPGSSKYPGAFASDLFQQPSGSNPNHKSFRAQEKPSGFREKTVQQKNPKP